MRGPKPQTPIVLTENAVQALQRLVRARTSPQGQVIRAQIVLAAHEHPEWSNQRIAQAVAQTDRTVRKWCSRWLETRSLADLPRPGAPRRFPPTRARPSYGDSL